LINFYQAGTTELFDDEAYYWIYSLFPSWGYFDHPPMIAILIKAGLAIFKNEFGVRFFIVLINTATIILISLIVKPRNDKLFYAISVSIGLAHVGGIIAVPDTPLLFFISLFFLVYRKFLERMDWLNTLSLGVSIALMLYSKYHGILIVVFTLLSNLKLLARWQTYLAGIIVLVLFAPHLYWQYAHDFPSVQYHLFERNARTYHFTYTTEYILAQLLLPGPIIGWLLIWFAIRYRSFDLTNKALQYSLVGVYLFFLINTIKGRVEANWTVPAFVPLIVLSHHYLNTRPIVARWVYRTVPISLLVVIAVRIYMMTDNPGSRKIIKDEFHLNKVWVNKVSQEAKGLPVVFINSYQRPSKLWFYKETPALSLNTPDYRRNNFNFWPVEESYIGEKVLALGVFDSVILKNKINAPRFQKWGTAVIPFYYSFMKAKITSIKTESSASGISTSFEINVPKNYLSYFKSAPFDTASIHLAILNRKAAIQYYQSNITVGDVTGETSIMSAHFQVQLPPGTYNARLGISTAIPGYPSLNSPRFRIRVDQNTRKIFVNSQ
jgi:hypothetical protein